MTEILPRLYLGDLADARLFTGTVICTMNAWPEAGNPYALWIPVVRAPLCLTGSDREGVPVPPDQITAIPQQLDLAADVIHDRLKEGQRVMVHCREGKERSPLTVAWYLRGYVGMPLDDGYALLRSLRPMVIDRRQWLPVECRR